MMWARVVEAMLGVWLAVSPFVFRHGDDAALWRHDFACALIVVTLSLACFARRLRRLHLLELPLALWLIVFGWLGGGHAPAAQNHMMVGLLLLMLAIVPSEATRPPPAWRRQPDAS